ncbi:hypothetical protein IGV50_004417 [Salmonella enterica subsp. enterica serovar Newport]|nr:hypothetical protein [Salmonella enterica subsp. enterica serovar Newport]
MDYNNFSFGLDDYQPTKSNVLGQSLAPTAGYSDELPAIDFQNDPRTPEDWKQGARQANIDADPYPDADQDSMYISQKGNKYQKVSNSRVDQTMAAVGAYLTTDLDTDNPGKAAWEAGQAVYNLEGKAKRFSQIDHLESTGRYADIDIDKWVETGDNADLTRNQGKWQNMGNGYEANTLTGETRQIPGYQQSANISAVNTGDQVVFYDKKTGQVVNNVATGIKPTAGIVSPGLDELEGGAGVQTRTDENGNTYYWKPFSNGKGGEWKPYTATAQKSLTEKQNANQPTANQQLVNNDLDTISAATPEQLDRFTGQFIGRTATGRDVATSLDPETRKIYQASERLGGQLANQAIAGAKAAGASGINTEAEIKRFASAVPQVDYTSPENYKASIAKIQQYAENFKNELIRSKGATPAPTQQAAPQGVTHVERGPDGKLRIVQG